MRINFSMMYLAKYSSGNDALLGHGPVPASVQREGSGMSESGGLRWPGSGAGNSADEAWLTAIAQAAAGDSQAPLELLVEYLSLLADAAISGRRPREHELAIVRELGRRAAEQGIPAGRVVDLYLSAAWRMWRDLPDVVP